MWGPDSRCGPLTVYVLAASSPAVHRWWPYTASCIPRAAWKGCSQLFLHTRTGGPICRLWSAELPVSGFVTCDVGDAGADGGLMSATAHDTESEARVLSFSLDHPAVILRWREGDESKTTISTGGSTSRTAAPASSQTAAPTSTTAPGRGARVVVSAVLPLILGATSMVAWLLT